MTARRRRARFCYACGRYHVPGDPGCAKAERPTDPSLFDEPRARSSDPETSHAAARAVRAGTWRARVLESFRAARSAGHDGLTDRELELLWPEARPQTVRTRRSELAAEGYVVDSGRTRRTDAGLEAIVWVLADEVARAYGW